MAGRPVYVPGTAQHTLDNRFQSIDNRYDPIPIGDLLLLVICVDWHFLKLIVAGNRCRFTPSLIYCSANIVLTCNIKTYR